MSHSKAQCIIKATCYLSIAPHPLKAVSPASGGLPSSTSVSAHPSLHIALVIHAVVTSCIDFSDSIHKLVYKVQISTTPVLQQLQRLTVNHLRKSCVAQCWADRCIYVHTVPNVITCYHMYNSRASPFSLFKSGLTGTCCSGWLGISCFLDVLYPVWCPLMLLPGVSSGAFLWVCGACPLSPSWPSSCSCLPTSADPWYVAELS